MMNKNLFIVFVLGLIITVLTGCKTVHETQQAEVSIETADENAIKAYLDSQAAG